MKRTYRLAYIAVLLGLMASVAMPQVRTKKIKKSQSQSSTVSNAAATSAGTSASPPVNGGGTAGQVAKFAGDGSVVVDSTVSETKLGNVGIGTTTPASKLSVQGTIESIVGGFKFPDGSTQTTAVSGKVTHDGTLTGDGSVASPLSVVPLRTDGTLKGNGKDLALGVAVPLTLFGNSTRNNVGVLTVANSAPSDAVAILAFGGTASDTRIGGSGLRAFGGVASAAQRGGVGLEAVGGIAVDGVDGSTSGKDGGLGAFLLGGTAGNGSGGQGAHIEGGSGSGNGHRGGTGVFAAGGPGTNGATRGLAGDFSGDVSISGNLSKGGGSFKIDHPLDPENKYLYHSFVESPDMKNIYDGTVTTDANGEATVTLPEWFEALNQDFRYQLTVIDTFAQAIVAQKIKGNRFVVRTSAPNVEVCWQVTGTRHDAYANKHRIPVEEQKPEKEQGLFLHPDAFNQSEEKGVQFVRSATPVEGIRDRSKQR